MRQRKIGHLTFFVLATLTMGLVGQGAVAGEYDDDHRIKIRGTSTGYFMPVEALNFPMGPGPFRAVSDVGIDGTFEVMVGDNSRTGRFRFPHLLVADVIIPPPPEGDQPPDRPTLIDLYVTGVLVWIFDSGGVVCQGPINGEFDENGENLVSRARLECNDGSRLRLRIRDTNVVGGEFVDTKIRGRLIRPGDYDW